MSITVNIHEAKTHLSRLLARASAGEEIIIAKAGKPMAKLVPILQGQERTPGIAKGRITQAFFDKMPENELETWEQ